MRRLTLLFAALFLAACSVSISPEPTRTIGSETPTPYNPVDLVDPTFTAIPSPTETPEPAPDIYYWLLLGGDFRQHRAGSRYGNKTDVMLLVTTKMTDPVQITVFQFPRNFYMPIKSMDDQWLFAVHGREGFTGLHYYFQEAFGIPLNGIFYVHMDNFVSLIKRAAPNGIPIRTSHATIKDMDGEQILEWLRDNDNMWGCGSNLMDCENRQFTTLRSLAVYFQKFVVDKPAVAAGIILDDFGDLFETDLSDFGQFVYLAEIAWKIKGGYEQIGIFKLSNSPYVHYGDTPLEVRGYIPSEGYDLHDWVPSILQGE